MRPPLRAILRLAGWHDIVAQDPARQHCGPDVWLGHLPDRGQAAVTDLLCWICGAVENAEQLFRNAHELILAAALIETRRSCADQACHSVQAALMAMNVAPGLFRGDDWPFQVLLLPCSGSNMSTSVSLRTQSHAAAQQIAHRKHLLARQEWPDFDGAAWDAATESSGSSAAALEGRRPRLGHPRGRS